MIASNGLPLPFFGNDYDELRDLDRARFAKCNVIHRPANTMGDSNVSIFFDLRGYIGC